VSGQPTVYHFPVDTAPRQTLQHAMAFLTTEDGQDQSDPTKVAIAKRLIRSAMLAMTIQGWRPAVRQ
jgi:ribosomal protein S7